MNSWILNNSAEVDVSNVNCKYFSVNNSGIGFRTYFTSNYCYLNTWGETILVFGDGNAGVLVNSSSKQVNIMGTVSTNSSITATGNITSAGFYESSDSRLKDNISDIQQGSDINFKQFNFKSDKDKTIKYGVIAQDLEDSGLKNLIKVDKDGMKSVDYISLLCYVVNKLQAEVKELKAKLNINNNPI